MESVGIRAMKAHFSAYVKQVARDRLPVAVTDRGKVVAVLQPTEAELPAAAYPSIEARILAAGGKLATVHGGWNEMPLGSAEYHDVDIQSLLNDLRGER